MDATRRPATTLDTLVAATPSTRDRYVDLLRALCIGVVVTWHWVFSVTHRNAHGALTMPNPIDQVPLGWLLTWFAQPMALFFVVGGFANRAGWQAAKRAGDRPGRAFLSTRLPRLLRPAAVYAAVWLVVDTTLRAVDPAYRGLWATGRVVLVPLWFLGVYLAVVLCAPLTARLHDRHPTGTLAAIGGAAVAGDLLRFAGSHPAAAWLTTAAVWLFAHQLGYWWRDGRITRDAARHLAIAGATALVLLSWLGPYPASVVATEHTAISNLYPTTLMIAALAVFQLGLAVMVRPTVDRWLARRRVWKATIAVNSVAMTVFCWHMTAVYAVIVTFEALGGHLGSAPTTSWWSTRPFWIVAPGVVLIGLVSVFRRFERPSAR